MEHGRSGRFYKKIKSIKGREREEVNLLILGWFASKCDSCDSCESGWLAR